MGDQADYDIEQGMDMLAAHQGGHCFQDCVYCNEKKQMKSHWYFITYYECPVCGAMDADRERRYTKKPNDPEDRCIAKSHYCGCEGY